MDKKIGINSLADRLLMSRRYANFDQRELSRRSGVSNGYISDIERSRVTNVGIEFIEALSKTLDVPPAWLAGWVDDSALSEGFDNEEDRKLSEEFRKLLDVFEKLTEDQRTTLLGIASILGQTSN